jgi:large subunit ribosomal protein L12
MEEVYACLLLHELKQPITVENLTKVLQSAGASVDEGKLKALVTSLEGQDIDQLIKQVPTTAVATETAKKEEAHEEKEKKEEAAVAGLSALFG